MISVKVKNLPPCPFPPTRAVTTRDNDYFGKVESLINHSGRPDPEPRQIRKLTRKPVDAIAKSAEVRSKRRKEREKRARELYLEGKTIPEIAAELGVGVGSAMKYTYDIRGKSEAQKARNAIDEKVAKLYRQGLIYDDIADRLGVTRSVINCSIARLHKSGKLEKRVNTWTRALH